MIDIVEMRDGVTRFKVRFKCEPCGCVFDTDEADYTRKKVYDIKHYEMETHGIPYTYKTHCPICGKTLIEAENDVEFLAYTSFSDGTESILKIDKLE